MELHQDKPTILTIGTFDGVHIGHQKIIKRLIDQGAQYHLIPSVLTFFPHPRMVLQKDMGIKLINTLEEKRFLLYGMGLSNMIVYPFSKEFSRMTALEFVKDLLVGQLRMKRLVIGYDHRFGRNRTASVKELIEYGRLFNFEVEEIPAQEIDEVSVSSSKIRTALEEGNIGRTNAFLGYEFMLSGNVIKGKGLGRKLQFPTANIVIPEEYKLIPKIGVYIVYAYIGGQKIYGMMNIGSNPTVQGNGRYIEVHFFNLDKDLYNSELRIHLLHRLRDEHKFNSIDELQEQLGKDRKASLKFIAHAAT